MLLELLQQAPAGASNVLQKLQSLADNSSENGAFFKQLLGAMNGSGQSGAGKPPVTMLDEKQWNDLSQELPKDWKETVKSLMAKASETAESSEANVVESEKTDAQPAQSSKTSELSSSQETIETATKKPQEVLDEATTRSGGNQDAPSSSRALTDTARASVSSPALSTDISQKAKDLATLAIKTRTRMDKALVVENNLEFENLRSKQSGKTLGDIIKLAENRELRPVKVTFESVEKGQEGKTQAESSLRATDSSKTISLAPARHSHAEAETIEKISQPTTADSSKNASSEQPVSLKSLLSFERPIRAVEAATPNQTAAKAALSAEKNLQQAEQPASTPSAVMARVNAQAGKAVLEKENITAVNTPKTESETVSDEKNITKTVALSLDNASEETVEEKSSAEQKTASSTTAKTASSDVETSETDEVEGLEQEEQTVKNVKTDTTDTKKPNEKIMDMIRDRVQEKFSRAEAQFVRNEKPASEAVKKTATPDVVTEAGLDETVADDAESSVARVAKKENPQRPFLADQATKTAATAMENLGQSSPFNRVSGERLHELSSVAKGRAADFSEESLSDRNVQNRTITTMRMPEETFHDKSPKTEKAKPKPAVALSSEKAVNTEENKTREPVVRNSTETKIEIRPARHAWVEAGSSNIAKNSANTPADEAATIKQEPSPLPETKEADRPRSAMKSAMQEAALVEQQDESPVSIRPMRVAQSVMVKRELMDENGREATNNRTVLADEPVQNAVTDSAVLNKSTNLKQEKQAPHEALLPDLQESEENREESSRAKRQVRTPANRVMEKTPTDQVAPRNQASGPMATNLSGLLRSESPRNVSATMATMTTEGEVNLPDMPMEITRSKNDLSQTLSRPNPLGSKLTETTESAQPLGETPLANELREKIRTVEKRQLIAPELSKRLVGQDREDGAEESRASGSNQPQQRSVSLENPLPKMAGIQNGGQNGGQGFQQGSGQHGGNGFGFSRQLEETSLGGDLESSGIEGDDAVSGSSRTANRGDFFSRISNAKETIRHFSTQLKEEVQNYKPPISRITLELNPKELGSVEVTLTSRGNALQVSIHSNQQAIQLFLQNSQDFRGALGEVGFSDVQMDFSSGNREQNSERDENGNGNRFEPDDEEEMIESVELTLPRYI